MSQQLFLYKPSRSEAFARGWGGWWDWLELRPDCRLVESEEEVVEGSVLVSFSAMRNAKDAFPDLLGKVRRVVAIDEEPAAIVGSCSIARLHRVEHVLCSKLIEDLAASLNPSSIFYLLAKAVWLPPFEVIQSLGKRRVFPKVEVDSTDRVLIVHPDARSSHASGKGFSNPLLRETARRMFETQGWFVDELAVNKEIQEIQCDNAKLVVLDLGRLGFDVMARLKFSCSCLFGLSSDTYFSFLHGGLPVAGVYSSSGERLRPLFSDIDTLARATRSKFATERRGNQRAGSIAGIDGFGEFLEGESRNPFLFARYTDELAHDAGREALRRAVLSRLSRREPSSGYLPLVVAARFFMETPPSSLALVDGKLEAFRAGLLLIRELLARGWDQLEKRGISVWGYLSWCDVLLGASDRVVESYPQDTGKAGRAWTEVGAESVVAFLCVGRVDHSNRLLKKVMAGVRHDLNTPLLDLVRLVGAWRLDWDVPASEVEFDGIAPRHRWTAAVALYGYARRIGRADWSTHAEAQARAIDGEGFDILLPRLKDLAIVE